MEQQQQFEGKIQKKKFKKKKRNTIPLNNMYQMKKKQSYNHSDNNSDKQSVKEETN